MIKLTQKCTVCDKWRWCGREHCRGAKFRPKSVSAEEDAVPATPAADVPEIETYPAIADDFPSADVSEVFPADPDVDVAVETGPVSTTYEYRDPEHRRAYKRKYMRDRRARLARERAARKEAIERAKRKEDK